RSIPSLLRVAPAPLLPPQSTQGRWIVRSLCSLLAGQRRWIGDGGIQARPMRATRSSGIQAKRPATLVTRLGDGMTSTRFGRLQPTRSSGIQAKHAAVPAATTTTSIQQRTGHYSVCLSRCPHLLPELIPAPSRLAPTLHLGFVWIQPTRSSGIQAKARCCQPRP
uniref:Uncharacterized protein n=2 Tax=Aegilops tauschii subsp. strangulata TaxID=200361 RepID=A0A453RGF9_AEGTS